MAEPSPIEDSPAPRPEGWSALVVDDETIIAASIEDFLMEAGAERVVSARSAAEALAALDGVPFTVAVVDWQLGRGDAGALVAALAAAGTGVVVVSGRHPEDLRRLLPAGLATLGKPFTDATLEPVVRGLVEARGHRFGGRDPLDPA